MTSTDPKLALVAAVLTACATPGPAASPGPGAPPPASCTARPRCTLADHAVDPSHDPLQVQLGCEPAQFYSSGATFNGPGSLCPDSADNRAVLHAHHKAGFLPGYCDPCLTVPDGKIFVFWVVNHPPPLCPSGCKDTPPSEL